MAYNSDSIQQGTALLSRIAPKIANFSIQYNLQAATVYIICKKQVAVMVMTSHNDVLGDESDFPEPGWAKTVLLAAVFAGSMAGMVCMGYLGVRYAWAT